MEGAFRAMMCASLVLAGCVKSPVATNSPPSEPNIGAVPAYVAIQNSKKEVEGDKDSPGDGMILWNASDIEPLGHGWCVSLHGIGYPSARLISIPVFVQQDGRAWRNDAVGARKYNGGADGLYAPPPIAAACHEKSASAPE